MTAMPLAILGTGLVTPVGLSAPASCAAFRAKISNPTETRFIDSSGKPVMAQQVVLEQPWRGLPKLARMATMAIEEALKEAAIAQWHALPLVLCVAESGRPGRLDGLESELRRMIEAELDTQFVEPSIVIAQGRVGVATALHAVRDALSQGQISAALIVAADSLLSARTLRHQEATERLLTERNSNGFIPGEGAAALLVGPASGRADEFIVTGMGFAHERAHISSEEPLRADGLSTAIRQAVQEAGANVQDFDYRVADLSGEQYYFKEASLAISRLLRYRKQDFPLWHPAECTGETGAAAGGIVIAAARAAAMKRYAVGSSALLHFASDAGMRAVLATRMSQ